MYTVCMYVCGMFVLMSINVPTHCVHTVLLETKDRIWWTDYYFHWSKIVVLAVLCR